MIENKTIAVLMTVHNRRETTLECLRHLFQNSVVGYTYKVYLVDDGCTDGTAEAVAKEFPEVVIIKGDGNLYWNRGMIRAWEVSAIDNPDYFLWLNDDTMIFETALNITIKDYVSIPNKSIIVGTTCSTTDCSQATYGGYSSGLITPNGTPQQAAVMNGNYVLIPQCVFAEVGMNDPVFTHSFGDREYSLRCRRKGVLVYTTSQFIGTCDRHTATKKCYNPSFHLWDRMKYFMSPLGNPPSELFHLYSMERGKLSAIKIVICHTLLVLFPKLAQSFTKLP